jgi:hypothetical protein
MSVKRKTVLANFPALQKALELLKCFYHSFPSHWLAILVVATAFLPILIGNLFIKEAEQSP